MFNPFQNYKTTEMTADCFNSLNNFPPANDHLTRIWSDMDTELENRSPNIFHFSTNNNFVAPNISDKSDTDLAGCWDFINVNKKPISNFGSNFILDKSSAPNNMVQPEVDKFVPPNESESCWTPLLSELSDSRQCAEQFSSWSNGYGSMNAGNYFNSKVRILRRKLTLSSFLCN